jgi:hypothetical protein
VNFDYEKRTIYLARHGSHAYGTNVETSDEDFKGVCVKPKECYLGFLNRFEQHEHMGSKSDGIDSVIYSLDKFVTLASDCNPSIIEVLFVDESDVVKIDSFGEELRMMRETFISKKAKHTFSGYATAQLKRIKTHKSWLMNPPESAPTREQFGLSSHDVISASELGAFNALNQKDEADKLIETLKLPKNVITLFTKEKQYQAAKTQFDQYNNWVKTRNPARSALEAKHGVDTKHAMHLIRLMRMCKEILATGKVNVKREDREELIAIRNGALSYDEIIEQADALETECNELYVSSSLR